MRQSVIKLYTIVSEKDLDARQRKLVNQAGTILMSDRKMTAKELLMVQRQLATIKSDGEDESSDDEQTGSTSEKDKVCIVHYSKVRELCTKIYSVGQLFFGRLCQGRRDGGGGVFEIIIVKIPDQCENMTYIHS